MVISRIEVTKFYSVSLSILLIEDYHNDYWHYRRNWEYIQEALPIRNET